MLKGLTFINFQHSTSFRLLFFTLQAPRTDAGLQRHLVDRKYVSGVAHRLLVLKRESGILGVAQSSHSFWRVSASLRAGCNLRRMAGAPAAAWLLGRPGRWGGALICAPDQWRNQLLIHKELLISQPGSTVSAVPVNGQCTGRLPRSFCAPGFGQQIIKGGGSPASRVMTGGGGGIGNKTQNEFVLCS